MVLKLSGPFDDSILCLIAVFSNPLNWIVDIKISIVPPSCLTALFLKTELQSQIFQFFQTIIFSESLEDENIKLLEMIRQREKTIKNLEVKTRNALEISIKADDGNLVLIFRPFIVFLAIRSNTDRVKRLEQENAALKEAQTKNSETKTDEKVKAKADNMAKQDDFVTFGLNLVSKINDLNTAVVGKRAKIPRESIPIQNIC